MLDVVLAAVQALRSRPVRTLSCGFGVFLGCVVLVVALGLGQTAEAQVSDRFDVFRATTIGAALGRGSSVTSPAEGFPGDGLARAMRLDGVTSVARYGVVENIPVTAASAGIATTTLQVNLVLADPTLLEAAGASVTGARLGPVDGVTTRHVGLVGRGVARELGMDRPGGTLFVHGVVVTVIGIIDDVQRLPELLRAIVLPEALAAELAVATVQPSAVLLVRPGASSVVGQRAALALRPDDPQRVQLTVPEDPQQLRRAVSSDVRSVSLIASIAVFVGGIVAVGNLMLLNVTQRVREIGLRRAVGASSLQVLGQILLEAICIGTIAGLLGSISGVWAVLGASIGKGWAPVIDLRVIILGVILGAGGGALGGLVPAVVAARVQPADALRL